MFNIKHSLIITLLIMILCSCQNSKVSQSFDTQNSTIEYVTVNDKKFTIKEINEGIKDTFNNVLYNYGNDDTSDYLTSNKKLLLNKELKYDLYFAPNSNTGEKAFVLPQKIYLVITNIMHPLSTEENSKFYKFGIDITQWGLRSDFSYQGYTSLNDKNSFKGDETTVYLGSYTMLIDSIKKPEYEIIDDKWQNDIKTAIRLYMDNNDFYTNKSDNLISGKYHIYVQGFFKSDKDSIIVFENENGSIYMGNYYFIHEIAENKPADLNKVELVSDSNDKSFKTYLENLRSNAALSMEYIIK